MWVLINDDRWQCIKCRQVADNPVARRTIDADPRKRCLW